jgi:hypothetical protein
MTKREPVVPPTSARPGQHLPRGSARERQQKDSFRHDALLDEPGNAGAERARLTCSSTGEDKQRAGRVSRGAPLFVVEIHRRGSANRSEHMFGDYRVAPASGNPRSPLGREGRLRWPQLLHSRDGQRRLQTVAPSKSRLPCLIDRTRNRRRVTAGNSAQAATESVPPHSPWRLSGRRRGPVLRQPSAKSLQGN